MRATFRVRIEGLGWWEGPVVDHAQRFETPDLLPDGPHAKAPAQGLDPLRSFTGPQRRYDAHLARGKPRGARTRERNEVARGIRQHRGHGRPQGDPERRRVVVRHPSNQIEEIGRSRRLVVQDRKNRPDASSLGVGSPGADDPPDPLTLTERDEHAGARRRETFAFHRVGEGVVNR